MLERRYYSLLLGTLIPNIFPLKLELSMTYAWLKCRFVIGHPFVLACLRTNFSVTKLEHLEHNVPFQNA